MEEKKTIPEKLENVEITTKKMLRPNFWTDILIFELSYKTS